MSVVQLIHSSAWLHKIQVSARFRVTTYAFISFDNCGSWFCILKALSLKSWESLVNCVFLQQSELALSLCQHISQGGVFQTPLKALTQGCELPEVEGLQPGECFWVQPGHLSLELLGHSGRDTVLAAWE